MATSARPALCPDILNTGSCTRPTGQCPFSHTTYGCEICNLLFMYEEDLQVHVGGPTHTQNLAGGQFTFLKCVACDVVVAANGSIMTQHELGKGHKKKIAQFEKAKQPLPGTVPIPGPGNLTCAACRRDVAPTAWSRHLLSPEHAERERYSKFMKAIEESAKDKFGVLVLQDQVDLGNIEKSRLLSEPTFKGIFYIRVMENPVVLTDVRMSSAVGTFASQRETNFFPRFTRHANLQRGNLYELSITFDPKGNSGRFYDRLELVFENQARDTRFAITRPVRAVVVASAIQELLAPIAPYVRPPPRPAAPQYVIDVGDKPAKLGKKRMGTLPEARTPQSIKDLRDIGSLAKRTAEVQRLMPAVFEALTYGDHWKILLWMEELQANKDMAMYDQNNVKFAGKGGRFYYVPGLAERRPSVVRGDSILVQAHAPTSDRWSRGFVHMFQLLQVGISFHQQYKAPLEQRINVRFELNRNIYQRMHLAVDSSFREPRVLFPTMEVKNKVGMSRPSAKNMAKCVPFFDKMKTNPPQWLAVNAIMGLPPAAIPFVVFGPPGTGKTVVIVEAIRQVLQKNPNAKIVACAPSNSAADIIANRLIDGNGALSTNELFRLNAPNRMPDMDPSLEPYSLLSDDGGFDIPPAPILQKYKVLVTTCSTAYQIHKIQCPKLFTHIFVDEAGQASEPEVMIAVKLVAGPQTNVILAGDPKQLGPVIRSAVGIKLGLDVSWLDRLMKLPLYDPATQSGITVVKLLHNFRSHNAILSYPNQAFYGGELQPRGDPAVINSCLNWRGLMKKKVPVVFHAVKGQDMREASSPSFFNPDEITIVKDYIDDLVKPGLGVRTDMIGIIAPYNAQCRKIRKLLEESEVSDVKVGSAEQFQGDERRVIIVSTVRSSVSFIEFDVRHTLGFVSNPRRFNVAMTRAQALLIVVGDPDVLGLDPLWRSFLNYIHNTGVWKGRAIPWDPMEIPDGAEEGLDARRRAQAAAEMEETALRTRQMILNREALDEEAEDEQEAREREAAEDQPVREAD